MAKAAVEAKAVPEALARLALAVIARAVMVQVGAFPAMALLCQ